VEVVAAARGAIPRGAAVLHLSSLAGSYAAPGGAANTNMFTLLKGELRKAYNVQMEKRRFQSSTNMRAPRITLRGEALGLQVERERRQLLLCVGSLELL
jgi:hypothetical protein